MRQEYDVMFMYLKTEFLASVSQWGILCWHYAFCYVIVKMKRAGLRRGGERVDCLFAKQLLQSDQSRIVNDQLPACKKDKRKKIWHMKSNVCAGFMRKQLDRVAKKVLWVNNKRQKRWMSDHKDQGLMSSRHAMRPAMKCLDLAQRRCLQAKSVSQESWANSAG